MHNQQFDAYLPVFVNSAIQLNEMEDETDFLQLGQVTEKQFYQLKVNGLEPSAMKNFPDSFKFISFEITHSFDLIRYERSTYDLLQYG